MARAHNALATCEIPCEVGDGIEFAGKEFERLLVEHMDKGTFGLHVADRERHEAMGRSVEMAPTFQLSVNPKVSRGSAERDRDVMHPLALKLRKGERVFLLARGIQKQFVGMFSQIAGSAVKLLHGVLNGATVPSRPRKLNVTALLPSDVLVAEDQNIVPADHKQVAQLFPIALEQIWVGPEIEENLVCECGKLFFGWGESDPAFDNGHTGATVRATDYYS